MKDADRAELVAVAQAERAILIVRGQRVMLDAELARLYGVTTGNLNKAVGRNRRRFPADFMFRLTREEAAALLFQSGRAKGGRGGRQTAPQAFSEQGVAMLSSVLRSSRAVEVNIAIMRAFVRLRELAATHQGLARRLDELERQSLTTNARTDARFRAVFTAIRQLMAKPAERPALAPRRRIGFRERQS